MNDAVAAMLMEAMANGGRSPDFATVAESLSGRRGKGDPRLAVLLELMRASQPPPEPPPAPSPAPSPSRAQARIAALRVPTDQAEGGGSPVPPAAIVEAMGQALQAERDELRRRNTVLAAALGACELCWGDDRACPSCAGTGAPGTLEVDPELFERYVRPAALSVQYPKPGPTPGPTPSEGE